MPKCFISYRRSDLGHLALWLADRLAAEFGARSVFVDRADLEVTRDFNAALRKALVEADVVIVLVGPTWLKVQDQYGRRRLDATGDIVRLEIEIALHEGKTILPIILGAANFPPGDALPGSIRPAFDRQAIIIENDALPGAVDRVIQALGALGFRKVSPPPILPDPRKEDALSLSDEEVEAALEQLPGWGISTTQRKDQFDRAAALYRRFTFAGFTAAMRYMAHCVDEIHRRQHHPRWQNTWRTVDVWLTTFDVGNRITIHDIELAKAMQSIYVAGLWRHVPPAGPARKRHADARPSEKARSMG